MTAKFTQSDIISPDALQKGSGKSKGFFAQVEALKEELKKVSWPSQEELRFSTKVVIASIFFFGFGIYFFDVVIKGFLDSVALIMRLIFG